MTLQTTGPISFNDINVELGNAGTAQGDINQQTWRDLAATSLYPPPSTALNSTISLYNFYGASNGARFRILVVAGGGSGGQGAGGGGAGGGGIWEAGPNVIDTASGDTGTGINIYRYTDARYPTGTKMNNVIYAKVGIGAAGQGWNTNNGLRGGHSWIAQNGPNYAGGSYANGTGFTGAIVTCFGGGGAAYGDASSSAVADGGSGAGASRLGGEGGAQGPVGNGGGGGSGSGSGQGKGAGGGGGGAGQGGFGADMGWAGNGGDGWVSDIERNGNYTYASGGGGAPTAIGTFTGNTVNGSTTVTNCRNWQRGSGVPTGTANFPIVGDYLFINSFPGNTGAIPNGTQITNIYNWNNRTGTASVWDMDISQAATATGSRTLRVGQPGNGGPGGGNGGGQYTSTSALRSATAASNFGGGGAGGGAGRPSTAGRQGIVVIATSGKQVFSAGGTIRSGWRIYTYTSTSGTNGRDPPVEPAAGAWLTPRDNPPP